MKNARPRGQFSESPRRRNIAYLEKQEEVKNPRPRNLQVNKENVEAIVKGNSDLEVFK